MFLFHLQLNWMVYVIAFLTGLMLAALVVMFIGAKGDIADCLVRIIMIAGMFILVVFPVWVIGFPNVNRLINATSVAVPAKISKTIKPSSNTFEFFLPVYEDPYVLVTSRLGTEKTRSTNAIRLPASNQTASGWLRASLPDSVSTEQTLMCEGPASCPPVTLSSETEAESS